PVHEPDDTGVLQVLEHLHFVVYHALVPLYVLLEDNLYGHLARGAIRLTNDAIGASSQGTTKSIFRSALQCQTYPREGLKRLVDGSILLIVALGLAMKPVKHV